MSFWVVFRVLLGVFFKICSHNFLIFEVKVENWFQSRRNRESRRKASVFAASFASPFSNYFEKTVSKQKFVHVQQLTLIFVIFFHVFDPIFVLSCSLNAFSVHSRFSFCLVNENSLNYAKTCDANVLLEIFFLPLSMNLIFQNEINR